ncbi:hypothetical protein [Sinorhizobium sp. CCBAU 05631]|uniref:hypothetical protein n=1 Tax=Sinorhizobium sp. CCBAU 05631 TaxID=794846 RepID=UPI0004B00BE7|nr:hypothetical protein [Sinorhizobium sp. CCBAU 05631]ASY60282.1 hypothetical protein SS05631_b61900 [Sinorhizobium sp. CCBAU 05631]
MRVFVLVVGIMALAAAPCAWDTDRREASAIAALVGGATSSEQGPMQAKSSRDTPVALNGAFK